MNILVTGATGFIGRALVSRFSKGQDRVFALTRDRMKAEALLGNEAEILEADVGDWSSIEKILPSQKIDAIFHLAASLSYFGPRRVLDRVNVEGTTNVCNWAVRNGVRKFVFASSIEAMGTVRREDMPSDEDYPCRPISSYGESKLEAERRVLEFNRKGLLETVVLRFGNVYGPGSPFLVLAIANAILNRDERLLRFLPVYKDYCLHPVYVDDAAELMRNVALADSGNIHNAVFIICGRECVTIEGLFQYVAGLLKKGFKIGEEKKTDRLYLYLRTKCMKLRRQADLIAYFTANGPGRVHRAYSIERAERELGFSPGTGLEEGINRTVEWAKKERLLQI